MTNPFTGKEMGAGESVSKLEAGVGVGLIAIWGCTAVIALATSVGILALIALGIRWLWLNS